MTQIDPSYWRTKEGAAFNAIVELCNPEASLDERLDAANTLRAAFGFPTEHTEECSIHNTDEPSAEDCDCVYWKEPQAA
jgi:hypothetical protein